MSALQNNTVTLEAWISKLKRYRCLVLHTALPTVNVQLVEAIVLPMTHKQRFVDLGIQPPKGKMTYH